MGGIAESDALGSLPLFKARVGVRRREVPGVSVRNIVDPDPIISIGAIVEAVECIKLRFGDVVNVSVWEREFSNPFYPCCSLAIKRMQNIPSCRSKLISKETSQHNAQKEHKHHYNEQGHDRWLKLKPNDR